MPGWDEGAGVTQELVVDERVDGEVHWICARGDVDLFTCPPLREALQRAAVRSGRNVVLDLCGVHFIDSTGIALMINAQRRLLRRGHEFHVLCPDGPVLRTLVITGIDENFRMYRSADDLKTATAAAPSA
jgi:anti-anti-sigma factor